MKKYLIISLLAIFCTSLITAQDKECPKKPTTEDFSREASLISSKLKLSGDTVQLFEDMYVSYKKEICDAMTAAGPQCEPKKGEKPTEAQIDAANRARFAQGRAMLNIRESYYDKFLTILKPSQIDKMYRLEKRLVDRKQSEMSSRKERGAKEKTRGNRNGKKKPSGERPRQ